MNNILYTIGHSQHDIEYFIYMLQKYQINFVIDVRSTPYSQFAMSYNRENIKGVLKDKDIEYSFMGKFFGARPEDIGLYTEEGYLDFDKTRKSIKFQSGVDNVIKGIQSGNRIALMCTEKDPIECHRAIMVARTFFEKGIDVQHILEDSTLQSHKELNQRLIDLYFPDRYQISLFSYENKSDEECLKEAYRSQNKKIGYYLRESKAMSATMSQIFVY